MTGIYDANSDRDWDDVCHGPYGEPRPVTRECVQCGSRFEWVYTGDKLCPSCDRTSKGIGLPVTQRKSA